MQYRYLSLLIFSYFLFFTNYIANAESFNTTDGNGTSITCKKVKKRFIPGSYNHKGKFIGIDNQIKSALSKLKSAQKKRNVNSRNRTKNILELKAAIKALRDIKKVGTEICQKGPGIQIINPIANNNNDQTQDLQTQVVENQKFYIVENRTPKAQIVLSPNAPETVKIAARHLQEFIQRMTTAIIPIRNTVNNSVPFTIYVGKSTYTDSLGINSNDCKYGSFKMVSDSNYLVLMGNDQVEVITGPHAAEWFSQIQDTLDAWDAITGKTWSTPFISYYRTLNKTFKIREGDQKGTVNAVYEFLYDQGLRIYAPGPLGTIVPTKSDIFVTKLNKHVKPDFDMRWFAMYYYHYAAFSSEDELKYQMSLRMNKNVDGPMTPLAHGVTDVTSRNETKLAYPDMYAIWNGIRRNDLDDNFKEDLCSERLLNDAISYARNMFDTYDVPMINMGPNDGFPHASESSPECKAKETPERGNLGKLSDYVFEFVNKVAKEVYKTHPNKKISYIAYNFYMMPPIKTYDISPNLVVGMARWRSPFDDPEQKELFRKITNDWLKLIPAHKIYIWDYYLHNRPNEDNRPNSYESIPVYFPRVIADDLRFLKGKSRGEFIEIVRNYEPMNLQWDTFAANSLNTYITARLYWDVNQDLDALLEEYYTLYFGPARDLMKRFIEYSQGSYRRATQDHTVLVNLRHIALEARQIAGNTIYGQRIDELLKLMNSRYLGEQKTINSCQRLDSPSTTYILSNNVSSAGTCFEVIADGVTLDCKGKEINFGTDNNSSNPRGIFINTEDDFKIKNCTFKSNNTLGSSAIYVYGSKNGLIEKNSIIASSTGVFNLSSSTNINQNTINTPSGIPLYIEGMNAGNITNNILTSNNNMGLYLYGANFVNISYNTSSSNKSNGLRIYNSKHNRFISNTVLSNENVATFLYNTTDSYFAMNSHTSRDNTGLRLYGASKKNYFMEESAIGSNYGILIGDSSENSFNKCGTIRGNVKNIFLASNSPNNTFDECS